MIDLATSGVRSHDSHVCQCEAYRRAIHPDLHAQGNAVDVPELGEGGKGSLGNVHTMLHIGHDVSIALCLAP